MWLVVGLGNPEDKYTHTRHNIGFRVIDSSGVVLKYDKAFNAALGKKDEILFCQPHTFMNLSGIAIQKIAAYYAIPTEQIVVIYDDKEIPFGRIRLRSDGSDAGHNGMKSIIETLGTKQFPRVRVGVGPKPERWDTADFVLAPFTKKEEKDIANIITAALEGALDITQNGMNPQRHRDIIVIEEESKKE